MGWTRHKEALKDPVCGMAVDPQTANSQTCYNGQTIFFCSPGCLQKFLAAPQDYRSAKKKGIWARYVARLSKAVAANPSSSCHG